MGEIGTTLAFALAAALATVFGGGIVLSRRDWNQAALHSFVAIGAGFMIGTTFVEMVPEAMALTPSAPLFFLAGYLLIHFFEHTLAPHLHVGEEVHTDKMLDPRAGTLAVVALSIHALFDGISIGSGVLVSDELGTVVFLAVLLHKIPDGFTVASILLASGRSRRLALTAAGGLGLATILGAIGISLNPALLGAGLSLSAGTLLYVAATDLLPEINRDRLPWMSLLVFAGCLLFFLTNLLLKGMGLAH
ncbi:MAG: ZIP family metal transporter [Candidatus Methylomirabilales bacterium]